MRIINLLFAWFGRPGKFRSVIMGGLRRTYFVHVPKGYDPKRPPPVVLALHGATMNGPMMAWFCGLNKKADEAGFVAVYPNGTGTWASFTWNGGNCCGSAVRQQVDDVAFINALLDDLGQVVPYDAQRVSVTGMSNGAILAYRLASELSERIAAIAPVAGPLGMEKCAPKRPVSVLHFHGTRDEFAPFKGGRGEKSLSGTDCYPVDHSIQTWVKLNGCDKSAKTETLSREGDDLKVTRQTYGGGKEGSEVVLVVIEEGGHTWPRMTPPASFLGRSAMNISANDLMWEFFQKHTLK